MFINLNNMYTDNWRAYERMVSRYLLFQGFTNVRLVGGSSDAGADILGQGPNGKRWLIQVKCWKQRVGPKVIGETLKALSLYQADIPAVVSAAGFTAPALEQQKQLMVRGAPLQLWDAEFLHAQVKRFENAYPPSKKMDDRPYQQEAIELLVQSLIGDATNKALVVLATGLGKTFVAAEALRRAEATRPLKVLCLAHTNELVYQLEKAFWPFIKSSQETLVWNGLEPQYLVNLERAPYVFACCNTVYNYIDKGGVLPEFDVVIIDECHHTGGSMYPAILDHTRAGETTGPFLLGLTATPWRQEEDNLEEYFGQPMISVDLMTGMKKGYLCNVDYRIHTDNIDWDKLRVLTGERFSPKSINRTLFINEWDDAVVLSLKKAWSEQSNPRAIVFCGTIDHAIEIRNRIKSLGFCNVEALYSESKGRRKKPFERNRILCDFADGKINVICAVDILNEGIDVPDVNIVVFQRVTHSRRIFIQQLGRGLRISEGKDRVIVLDFVSDIRRFAAGINLQRELRGTENQPRAGRANRIQLDHKVTFTKFGGEDSEAETYLKHWLDDVTAIEAMDEDAGLLRFPPPPPENPR